MKKIAMDVDARAERRRRIAVALRKGTKVAQSAADFGVSEALVRNVCREYGIKLRPIHSARLREPTAERNEQMCREFCGGSTLQQVADKHGLTRQRVHAVVQSAGLSAADGGFRVALARRERALEMWRVSRGFYSEKAAA